MLDHEGKRWDGVWLLSCPPCGSEKRGQQVGLFAAPKKELHMLIQISCLCEGPKNAKKPSSSNRGGGGAQLTAPTPHTGRPIEAVPVFRWVNPTQQQNHLSQRSMRLQKDSPPAADTWNDPSKPRVSRGAAGFWGYFLGGFLGKFLSNAFKNSPPFYVAPRDLLCESNPL